MQNNPLTDGKLKNFSDKQQVVYWYEQAMIYKVRCKQLENILEQFKELLEKHTYNKLKSGVGDLKK